jgi:hypothetical protein
MASARHSGACGSRCALLTVAEAITFAGKLSFARRRTCSARMAGEA